jgi:outer membrane protein TolC
MILSSSFFRQFFLVWLGCLACAFPATAETVPLKRAVELALSHSTTMAAAHTDEQRAFAAYLEQRNQYLPQFMVGSGLGKSWGYPLALEGSGPSVVNLNTQSAVFNPALREFVRAARVEYQESGVQTKNQREQVIQDTVLSYAELCKWQSVLSYASREYDAALKTEQAVNRRVQEGVDNALARNRARLVTARVYLRISQAQGSIDVLRNRLSQLTGLPAESIEADADSMPKLPEVKQEDDLVSKAEQLSRPVEIADIRASALAIRARGEHRAMWPTLDFASQYAVFAKYSGYQNFFRPGSFQNQNGTVGVVIRFPFFSSTQRARAQAADADAQRARKDVDAVKNRVSEQTLKLQRSVDQLEAAQQVTELEYEIAKSNLDAAQVRVQSGSATWHDAEDARVQASERYGALQDANFELQRARIALLRATGEISDWLGVGR